MLINIKKWIFRKNKNKHIPYIEHDTECDKCIYLEQCKNDGFIINRTTCGDTREHFIIGFKSYCRKLVARNFCEFGE